jgi:hypothetical protein
MMSHDNEDLPVCPICKDGNPIDFADVPWWREDLIEQTADHEGMLYKWRVEPICAEPGKPGRLPPQP